MAKSNLYKVIAIVSALTAIVLIFSELSRTIANVDSLESDFDFEKITYFKAEKGNPPSKTDAAEENAPKNTTAPKISPEVKPAKSQAGLIPKTTPQPENLPLSQKEIEQNSSSKSPLTVNPLSVVSLDCFFASTTAVRRGSGIIVRNDGLILTNRHLAAFIEDDWTDNSRIYPLKYCEVALSSQFNREPEKIYQASLLWSSDRMDPDHAFKMAFDGDFVFLKINKLLTSRSECLKKYPGAQIFCSKYPEVLPISFPFLTTGDASQLKIQEQIKVIGFPSEFYLSSKLFQVAGPITEIYANVIEASVPVEKGFSGAAVLNENNELVGLLNAGKTGNVGDFLRMDWIGQNNPIFNL